MAVTDIEVFKKRYGNGVTKILPEETGMCKLFDYVDESGRAGADFNQSIETQLEGGITFNLDGSAFTLAAAIPAIIKRATVGVAEILLRGSVSYGEVMQSMNAGAGSQGRAVIGAVENKMAGMARSGDLYRELQTTYGCGTASTGVCSIGVVNASINGANLGAPQLVNITRATWNSPLWQNIQGHLVDIYQSDFVTLRAAGVTVSAPTDTTNRITLTKAASAITVVAGDVIVLSGALAKQPYGVQALLENAGSILGISAATYPVWQAISYAVGGQLSIAKVRGCATRLYNKGLTTGGTLKVGAMAFADLSNELENDQRINDDRGARKMGPSSIVVRTTAGDISVEPYAFMKQGISMLFGNDAECGRYGAGELSFDLTGIKRALEVPSATTAGYEFRMYGQSSPLIKKPAHCAILTGIQSTDDTSPA